MHRRGKSPTLDIDKSNTDSGPPYHGVFCFLVIAPLLEISQTKQPLSQLIHLGASVIFSFVLVSLCSPCQIYFSIVYLVTFCCLFCLTLDTSQTYCPTTFNN